MATKLMEQLATHEGYCCLYALFHYNRNVRSGAFAKRYGVSRQTIIYWRKRYQWKQLKCEEKDRCLSELLVQSPSLS